MANAPKKRPPTLRSDRRPPRGPHPVPAKDTNLRPRLTAASSLLHKVSDPNLDDAAKLREIKKVDPADLADAIDIVLAPNGWGRLRRSDPTTSDSLDRNMAMRMPSEWREQIKARAQAAGNKLARDVNEGYELYLDGKFSPKQPARQPTGSGVEMVNLNVRPDNDLRIQVTEAGIAPAHLGAMYLMSKYQVGPYAPKKAAKK